MVKNTEVARRCSAGQYQADAEHVRFCFKIPTSAMAQNHSDGGKILFVVDNSSSMHGNYNSVKSAVKYMIGRGEAQQPEFVLYNTHASFASANQMLASSPTGCTSFEAAFSKIQEYIGNQPIHSSINIVFMTDGEDTSSSALAANQKMFKIFLANCMRQVVVHTLGFGRSHNRAFLEELSQMGSSAGCYRYAETGSNTADNLDDSFASIFDFLVHNVTISLRVGSLVLDVDAVKEVASEDEDEEDEDDEDDHLSTSTGDKLSFDIVLKRRTLRGDVGIGEGNEAKVKVQIEAGEETAEVELVRVAVDPFFKVRCIEESEVESAEDLEHLQKQLIAIDPFKAFKTGDVREARDSDDHAARILLKKARRAQLVEMRQLVQEKLDKYSTLFASIARGVLNASGRGSMDSSVAAQLHSLRHETKFSKARRARSMEKRARTNVDQMVRIGQKLAKLHRSLNIDPFVALERRGQRQGGDAAYAPSLACTLSGDGIVEVMRDSADDIMVFALSVERPEEAVDAPTSVRVQRVCAGTYSNQAFTASTKFAISQPGSSTATVTGGFIQTRKATIFDSHPSTDTSSSGGGSVQTTAGVGVFRGPDGELMNSCLPLYLNDQHWARVKAQMKPLLGWFFTLDPLGFHERQYVALYMLLGEMHAMRANGSFSSDWATWLIEDFTKTCVALLPTAEAVVAKWKQAGGGGGPVSAADAGGAAGDLLADFLRGPAGRSKEHVPNLMVAVGWKMAKQYKQEQSRGVDQPEEEQEPEQNADEVEQKQIQEQEERFMIAMVEEIWRRNFNRYYKQHPGEAINGLMERLLYGPARTEQQPEVRVMAMQQVADPMAMDSGSGASEEVGKKLTKAERRARQQTRSTTGNAAQDRPFSTFAHLKWGTLKQSDLQSAEKAFGKKGERPPTLKPHGGDGGYGTFSARPLAAYDDHPSFFDELVAQQLVLIEPMNRHLAKLFDGLPLGKTLGAGMSFPMELQRLVLVQALRFRTNSAANSGVSSGEYKNTFDFFKCNSAAGGGGIGELLTEIHTSFEQKRREGWDTACAAQRDLQLAKAIALARDPAAFAGKLMSESPTRGGGVFMALAAMLGSGFVEDTNTSGESKMVAIPMLEQKVRALLTGKISIAKGGTEYVCMSRGQSWTACPMDLASRLKHVVGEDAFVAIEMSMYGSWGHVYRESDIPNRHGHCNSCPNDSLGGSFRGFKL
jgi:hypothetical protein